MKYFFLILSTLFLINCSSGKQTPTQENPKEQTFIEFIHKLKKDNDIHPKAVVIINEKLVKEEDLKKLTITSSDIIALSVSKERSDDLIPFYGEKSKYGLILITTNATLYKGL